MSSEHKDWSIKAEELHKFAIPIYRLFLGLELETLSRVSFVHNGNELINQVLGESLVPGPHDTDSTFHAQWLEHLDLAQSFTDIHFHTQKVRRAFRKAALHLSLEEDLENRIIDNIRREMWTLFLLLQQLRVHNISLTSYRENQKERESSYERIHGS